MDRFYCEGQPNITTLLQKFKDIRDNNLIPQFRGPTFKHMYIYCVLKCTKCNLPLKLTTQKKW